MIFQPYDRILIKVSSVPRFLNFILNFSKPSIENLIFLLSSFGGPTNLFDLVANFRIFFFFLRKGICQSLNFIFHSSFRIRKVKITFVSFCLFSSSFCIFLRSFSSLALCRCSFAISLCLRKIWRLSKNATLVDGNSYKQIFGSVQSVHR